MGCLNSKGQFNHWFANIHLSGPCNRSCYFCIGQHMMALDSYNVMDTFPLLGWETFVEECKRRQVKVVYLTGTNTDPLLYKHIPALADAVKRDIGVPFGIRTNAVAHIELMQHFDMGSVSISSFNPEIYKKMMGQGKPPVMADIMEQTWGWQKPLKVNVVLGPENTGMNDPSSVGYDLYRTLDHLWGEMVQRVNLREPYGQTHIGDPLARVRVSHKDVLGMPCYIWRPGHDPMEVTYWDVHYVEVESVNLYASGRVSTTYPISKGHTETGEVHDQSYFPGGRVHEQWVK